LGLTSEASSLKFMSWISNATRFPSTVSRLGKYVLLRLTLEKTVGQTGSRTVEGMKISKEKFS